MQTHHESDSSPEQKPGPSPVPVSPGRANRSSSLAVADHSEPERTEKPVETRQPAKSGRRSFSLSEVRSVALRCDHCQTVVRFPRVRWARSPESCPNCGAPWTRQPSSQDPLSEDASTHAFRVLLAFREALHALAGMNSSAVFTIALETAGRGSEQKVELAVAAPNGRRHG